MCGIFGQYNPRGADLALVERMAACLAHRGPDGYGTHSEQRLAFGAGRLAIIDLSAPAGPLYSEDRQTVVVFNGEIYNHRVLRNELERAGHQFATHTDTEVIVHGYEAWGMKVFERLQGMFAIGLWDARAEHLILARDRMGEKPLYFAPLHDGEVVFASEAKALFEHVGVRRAVNRAVMAEYVVLGFVAPPNTLFDGIFKLAPAETLTISCSTMTRERYWHPEYATEHPPSYADAVKQVRRTLTGAVERQMMSDVPIGAFLSGGVDSSAVVGLMRRFSPYPVRTFTVGFEAEPGSPADLKFNVDVRYAADVARHFGTEHRVITLPNDERIAWVLPHLIGALDEPISMPTVVQTVFVAALARAHGVPVLLSGEGSDEAFFGYSHYRAEQMLGRYLRVPALLRNSLLNPLFERTWIDALRRLVRKARQTSAEARYLEWLRRVDHQRAHELLRSIPDAGASADALAAVLKSYLNAPGAHSFVERIAWADGRLVLAENMNMRVDKMCMAMSVEARAPFQDLSVVELGYRLPVEYKLGGDSKRVLKDALRGLVPENVLHRPKWGFNPPASDWMRNVLRPLIETLLTPERVAAVGVFRPETIQAVRQAHIVERKYEMWSLWTALVFHLWHAIYIEESFKLDKDFTPDHLVDMTGQHV
ncbi:MAG: asparagine synthase (glutamine-hydrolyzing) [Chloroflexi bacterium]|nr:asparagine synthase (glutamine-hydrolyzing) [Chloroflexota bacterium]